MNFDQHSDWVDQHSDRVQHSDQVTNTRTTDHAGGTAHPLETQGGAAWSRGPGNGPRTWRRAGGAKAVRGHVGRVAGPGRG